MAVAISIKKMTFEEKLTAIELLWDDLCKTPDRIKSPAWHGEILAERQSSLKNGKVSFSSWESAKVQIRKRVK